MLKVMIAYANSAGDRWAAWVLGSSLDAALLLAMIGLVWLAIRGKVAPQVGYALFLLVPVKTNRIIHQLREYACDDFAIALSRMSPVECGEAFVQILRHAGRGRRGLEGALGVFGLDSRTACLLRCADCWIRTDPSAPHPAPGCSGH